MPTGDPWCAQHGFTPCSCREKTIAPVNVTPIFMKPMEVNGISVEEREVYDPQSGEVVRVLVPINAPLLPGERLIGTLVRDDEKQAEVFCWSLDGERYEGDDHDTRERALEQATEAANERREPGTHIVHTGIVWREPLSKLADGLGERMLDLLMDRAHDEVGDLAEDWLSSVKREHEDLLDKMLATTIERWAKATNNEPTFHGVRATQEHTVEVRSDGEVHDPECEPDAFNGCVEACPTLKAEHEVEKRQRETLAETAAMEQRELNAVGEDDGDVEEG